MRIVFVVIGNSRRSNYLDGDTLRYGSGGGSGTDTSSIAVAEYLASVGNEVVYVQDPLEPELERKYLEKGISFIPGKNVRGVTYTNINFDAVENKDFDILISSLWFEKYEDLPINIEKAVIYWCHMQWIYGIDSIISFSKKRNIPIGFVHISNWEKQMTEGVVDFVKHNYDNVKSCLIPNPILDDIVEEVVSENIKRKNHKFIFHAAWARGGNVSVEAVRQLPYEDKEFHAFDYLMATHAHEDSFFNLHNGVDKKTLFKELAESDYFIYPLYTPYQDVHKDTFSCVVAEAIALGAIVITYPLGALPEYYDDYCIWLDFPENVNPEEMQKEALTKDYTGKFTCTNNILEKIYYLENNPEVKENIRKKGKDYILNSFNINKVGNMWVNFINTLF